MARYLKLFHILLVVIICQLFCRSVVCNKEEDDLDIFFYDDVEPLFPPDPPVPVSTPPVSTASDEEVSVNTPDEQTSKNTNTKVALSGFGSAILSSVGSPIFKTGAIQRVLGFGSTVYICAMVARELQGHISNWMSRDKDNDNDNKTSKSQKLNIHDLKDDQVCFLH